MRKVIILILGCLVGVAACDDDKKLSTEGEGGSSDTSDGVVYPVYKSGSESGHGYVDLGLSSGTKWATCNVGATQPQEYGDYFAWGEVKPKDYYDWSTYKYGSDYNEITKYCGDSDLGKDGFTDDKDILNLSDDAAYVNWGGKWRMPTYDQIIELLDECYWVWTDGYNNSKKHGYIVYKAKSASDKGILIEHGETPSASYSLTDAHIFMPAAGCRVFGDYSGRQFFQHWGYYWSSSLDDFSDNRAENIYFYEIEAYYGDDNYYDSRGSIRYVGMSVRAVIPGD